MGWLLWILLSPTLAAASADSKPDEGSRDFSYVEMAPAFIVNIGGSGRIGFLKVDVSLRVESTALGAVQQHMPALRHELIMRLSGQNAETLQSVESREALRAGALAAVQKIIQDEAGIAGITDLLFTSFMVQR
jgi:flagellar FliL protein